MFHKVLKEKSKDTREVEKCYMLRLTGRDMSDSEKKSNKVPGNLFTKNFVLTLHYYSGLNKETGVMKYDVMV